MSNTNLAVRFTDDVYASRQLVARELGTNLIDSIWKDILDYRKQFLITLPLYDVTKSPFSLTLTNSIKVNCRNLKDKISGSSDDYIELQNKVIGKDVLNKDMLKISLKYLANFKGIIANDIGLENILKDLNNDLLYTPLVNYLNALKAIKNYSFDRINEDLLAYYLEVLSGNNELSFFYRSQEIDSPSQKVLINREYNGAPVALIEPLMNNLFSFINDESNDLIVRIATSLFMINYIKPFEKYNEEISVLVAKSLLTKCEDKEFVSILPLEVTLYENKSCLNVASKEAQKNRDITYYLNEIIRLFDDVSSAFNNRLIQLTHDSLADEYFDRDENKIEESIEKESSTVQPNNVELTETKVVEENEPKKVSIKKEKAPQFANNEPMVNVHKFEELDEKALNRAATDLLESDPNLRPSQAHFYVRHCTLGKYYTIQQFKKCEKVVYETARTSMEYLARAGYYRREQVKNKFVYTPISK